MGGAVAGAGLEAGLGCASAARSAVLELGEVIEVGRWRADVVVNLGHALFDAAVAGRGVHARERIGVLVSANQVAFLVYVGDSEEGGVAVGGERAGSGVDAVVNAALKNRADFVGVAGASDDVVGESSGGHQEGTAPVGDVSVEHSVVPADLPLVLWALVNTVELIAIQTCYLLVLTVETFFRSGGGVVAQVETGEVGVVEFVEVGACVEHADGRLSAEIAFHVATFGFIGQLRVRWRMDVVELESS